jgi:hypothetical protein
MFIFAMGRLGRAEVNGFQTLRKRLMICVPKNSPPKFQPSIRGRTARTKTRVEKEHSVNHGHCTSQP